MMARCRKHSTPFSRCWTSNPIEVNIFRGTQPAEDRQRVFGGQVAGQALVAAARTVDEGSVHSLHSYFLRPGDPSVPILYEVDRIRDGRSFTTRRVVAIQHGRAIFNLQASFHVVEDGFEHQAEMPDVPDPDTLPSRAEIRAADPDAFPAQWPDRPQPIDIRYVSDLPYRYKPGRPPAQLVWMRANGTMRRRSAPAHLRARVPVGHDPARHVRAAAPVALSRRRHGREPRSSDVVPPAVPCRRVDALRHGFALGAGRTGIQPRSGLHP